jgi:hypothetical protein
MTITHAALPIIARISLFQVNEIHLDIFSQYVPGPWVPAPSSGIYRFRNSAPERQLSAGFFSVKTAPDRAKETALSSIQCDLKHAPTSAQSHSSFLKQQSLQVGNYYEKRDITEIHPASPHIDRISPLRVYRIYQETLLQYFPNLLRGNPDLGRAFSSSVFEITGPSNLIHL